MPFDVSTTQRPSWRRIDSMRPTPGTTSPASHLDRADAAALDDGDAAADMAHHPAIDDALTRRIGGGGRGIGRCGAGAGARRRGGLLRLDRAGRLAARRLGLRRGSRLRAIDALEPLGELGELRIGIARAAVDARLDRGDLRPQARDRVAHRGEIDRRHRRLRRCGRTGARTPRCRARRPSRRARRRMPPTRPARRSGWSASASAIVLAPPEAPAERPLLQRRDRRLRGFRRLHRLDRLQHRLERLRHLDELSASRSSGHVDRLRRLARGRGCRRAGASARLIATVGVAAVSVAGAAAISAALDGDLAASLASVSCWLMGSLIRR